MYCTTEQQQLKHQQNLGLAVTHLLAHLDNYIADATSSWVQKGTQMAITNCCALMHYGRSDNVLFTIFNKAIIQIPLGQTDDATKYRTMAVGAGPSAPCLGSAEGSDKVGERPFAQGGILDL